jgi:NAD-dependent dihydropyrimidine dehydrogenase PreA subunit
MATKLPRKIIRIDEEKCDGCGQCVLRCAEGAIQIIDGKARLVGESLCDGLGACLGECPVGAIIIEERPAEAFDPEAVERRKQAPAPKAEPAVDAGCRPQLSIRNFSARPAVPAGTRGEVSAEDSESGGARACGCPGSMPRELRVLPQGSLARGSAESGSTGQGSVGHGAPLQGSLAQAAWERLSPAADEPVTADAPSRLAHWPVQLALVPPAGPMWQDADVLIAADCVPFALAGFHEKLLRGKSLAVACPKLDDVRPYVEKLAHIFAKSSVRSVTVAHMEVPCCLGIVQVVRKALEDSGRRDIPLHDITVALSGAIL